MSRRGSVEVTGGPEIANALRGLGKSLGKGVLRRVGIARLKPMADAARSRARQRSGALAGSIIVGTRLARSQSKARGVHVGGGEFRRDAKNSVTVHMGPGQHPQAITEEFGTVDHAANPYMRPAFDQHAQPAVTGLADDFWGEISKTVARVAKKAARKAAKGG